MIVLDSDTLTHLIAGHPRVVERYRREVDEVVITIMSRIEVLEGRFATLRKAANGAELQRGQQRLDQAERDLSAFRALPIADLVQRSQIEEELLRGKIRVLQGETDYVNALDQLARRSPVSEVRRRQLEDAAISPLTKVFQHYEELSRDFEAASIELVMRGNVKDVTKLRPGG